MWQECRRNLDIWWAEHGWAWPNSAGWTMRNHRYSQPFGDHSDHSIPSHPVDGSVASRIPPQTRREPLSTMNQSHPFTSWQSPEVTFDHFSDGFSCIGDDSPWRMSLAKQRRLRRCGWLLAQLQDVRADRCSLREPTGTQKVVMNSDEWWSNGQWIQLIHESFNIYQYLSVSQLLFVPRKYPDRVPVLVNQPATPGRKTGLEGDPGEPMIAASALRDCWWLNVINKC